MIDWTKPIRLKYSHRPALAIYVGIASSYPNIVSHTGIDGKEIIYAYDDYGETEHGVAVENVPNESAK